MRTLVLVFFAMWCLRPVTAQEHPLRIASTPIVPARFGIPARFDSGILQYPGFTVQFSGKTEFFRSGGQPPWVIQIFEVLKDGKLTIGGDIIFNSEKRANGRRFEVDGKIYIAELYHSTAGLREGEIVPMSARLADDEIVIWDEASAKSGNLSLAKIWQNEKVQPGARYITPNAYSNGVFLRGFSNAPGTGEARSRLKPDSLEVEQVEVLSRNPGAIADGVVRAYGERTSIYSGAIKYPDLTVMLVSQTENHRVNGVVTIRYEFEVRAASPSEPGEGFSFDTYTLGNGSRFTVNGVNYFAEMFATTAVASVNAPNNVRAGIPLKQDQLIVWDQSAAQLKNPHILPALEGKSSDRSPRAFAGGAPLGFSFTGTYMYSAGEFCERDELDAPLQVLKDSTVEYPVQFAGSGYIGQVHGFLVVGPDGMVAQGTTSYGHDISFKESSARAICAMRFTPPKKNGQPTKVRLSFSWSIAEPNCDTTTVVFH